MASSALRARQGAHRPGEAARGDRRVARGGARHYEAEDAVSTLAGGSHQIGGACALIGRHADGPRIFGAVDRIGFRYGDNPVAAEGEDTRRLPDIVAAGLSEGEYDRAYQSGVPLEFEDLFALVDSLPRADAAGRQT